MALETIQAVREAEINAEKKEKDALIKKETIISQARQNAYSLVSAAVKEAQLKAELKLNETKQKGADLMEASKFKAEKEVLLMKEMLKEKEQTAINLIISSLI